MTTKQKIARRHLLDFLGKLNFKKAQNAQLLETMNEWMERIQSNYGTPDTVYISPQALNAYQRVLGTAPQAEDTEVPEQSSKVPCGNRAQ